MYDARHVGYFASFSKAVEASCWGELKRCGATNLSLFVEEARLGLAALPEAPLERVFILFPDPWPKLRHHMLC